MLKQGDTVEVVEGCFRGKRGKVEKVFKDGSVLVSGWQFSMKTALYVDQQQVFYYGDHQMKLALSKMPQQPSLVAAKTSVVIGKKEKYAFNGKKLKPGTYQITSYNSDTSETERELEAQNAFESMKRVTSSSGWHYMGEIKAEDMTKKLVCSKHGQAYVMIEGCPWCE